MRLSSVASRTISGTIAASAFALGSLGCSGLLVQTETQDTFLRMDHVDREPRQGASTSTQWRFDGADLVVTPEQWNTCERAETRVYRRRVLVSRKLQSDARWFYVVVGAGLAGAGAVRVARPDESLAGESWTHDQSLAAGYASIGLGGLLLLAAVVETVRAADSVEDLGEHRVATGTRLTIACQQRGADAIPVTLEMPDGSKLRGERDGDGYRFRVAGGGAPSDAGDKHVAWLVSAERREPVLLLLSPDYRRALPGLSDGGAK